jgi:hypothetical protein
MIAVLEEEILNNRTIIYSYNWWKLLEIK